MSKQVLMSLPAGSWIVSNVTHDTIEPMLISIDDSIQMIELPAPVIMSEVPEKLIDRTAFWRDNRALLNGGSFFVLACKEHVDRLFFSLAQAMEPGHGGGSK